MSQKIAVAIIHGIGKQEPDFADGTIAELTERFAGHLRSRSTRPETEVVMRPVYWAPVLQGTEQFLWKRVQAGGDLDFISLRRFMIDFAADAIAYQPLPNDRSHL